ncbi:hypothetical protein TD95_001576 [Thielaviopsis punctulata]|uniref:RRM domain-containing protein n=1 Tax=Thielaviopsis punctulata TaxID=72032 RepID=A0A0F4ZHZ7_9PEZI|nr:hypothetical protein TD95_001576 [Thielaviopsis punctulata]
MSAAAAADAATNGVTPATEPAPVAEEKVAAPAAAATESTPDQTSVAEGRRLYLGNVAYAATEEALKEFFKGFDVKSVSIPKNPHTNKSVGYAFVDVATTEEAQRAIAELDREQILERKVSVQIARPPQEPSGENEGRRQPNGRSGRLRRRAQGKKEDKATTPAADATSEAATATETAEASKSKPPVKSRSPKRKTHKGPPENGVQSKVKVMVTNLPYHLTEEQLKELFKDYNPVSAKVALRPIASYMIKKLQARGEPRKGRGFGFVTLENEEMQQKAIKEMNEKEVDDRKIEVKVAIDSPDKVDRPAEAGEEKKAEAAPAAAPNAAQAAAAPEATKEVAASA